MEKILVLGAGGFVGARIMQQLGGRFDMLAAPRGFAESAGEDDIKRLIFDAEADVVILAAALSDTGFCEDNPELSYKANVILPVNTAKAAAKAGAKLIAFSSDQVYAGCALGDALNEDIALKPTNVYGRHKLEAEQRVLDILPEAVLLRATWMYDLPSYGLPIRPNLPLRLLCAALRGEKVSFSVRDYRSVTYVRQVIDNLPLAFSLCGGAYNFGSENTDNMFDTALAFAREAEMRIDIEKADFERNISIDCSKIRAAGIEFDSAQAGFERCLRDYGLKQGK